MRKKCCYGRKKNFGQYSSLSPSPAHLSHTTNTSLSRIKCERYIFIKMFVRSLKFVYYVWLCFCLYLYYGYTTLPLFRIIKIFLHNLSAYCPNLLKSTPNSICCRLDSVAPICSVTESFLTVEYSLTPHLGCILLKILNSKFLHRVAWTTRFSMCYLLFS